MYTFRIIFPLSLVRFVYTSTYSYISTTDLLELSVNGPSLYWSEESIEAAMRWEEGMDGHCIEGRSAVSCSDLLLSLRLCSNGRKVRCTMYIRVIFIRAVFQK